MGSTLHTALYLLVKPVAAFCLRHGLKLQDIVGALKQALREAAIEELEHSGDTASDSRVSVMTGLHRKDLRQLKRGSDAKAGLQELRARRHVISRVIAEWEKRGKRRGEPPVLPTEGDDSAFFKLVQSVSSDLNPYTVLYELERAGLIEQLDDGLRLKSGAYVLGQDAKAIFEQLSSDSQHLITAVEQNALAARSIRNLHLTTEYDNIPAEFEEEIRAWMLKAGSDLHAKVRSYLSARDRDNNGKLNKRGGTVRAILGTFSVTETVSDEEAGNDDQTEKA